MSQPCTEGFPDCSVSKESACNAGDSSSIPGSGRSTGERIGYPLQYSWTSLVAQLVQNPPAMWETWVRFLGWEDPLEKGKATHSSMLVWRIPWMDCIVHGMLQDRIMEWVTVPFSRGFSQPRNQTQVSHIAGGFCTREVQRVSSMLKNTGIESIGSSYAF